MRTNIKDKTVFKIEWLIIVYHENGCFIPLPKDNMVCFAHKLFRDSDPQPALTEG